MHKSFIKLTPSLHGEGVFYCLKVIPSSWYQYTRGDVDISTKRKAVKDAFDKWHEWETGTKKYYETMYKTLFDLGEFASALKVSKMIKDVDKELKWVCRKKLELESADYGIGHILAEQKFYHDFYKKK